MTHAGDEAKPHTALGVRLRMWLLILLVILTGASGANVWYTLSTRDDVPAPAATQSEAAAAPAESWDPKYDALEPHKSIPAWLSYLMAFGLGVALPGAWIVVFFVSYVRWKVAAAQVSSIKGRARKWSGKLGKRALQGEVVAIDTGAQEAFVVEIDQRYDENATHWMEISRRQVIRPFTMALPRGQHLRVEPDDRAQLAVALEEPIELEKSVRRRRACSSLGDTVCVVGRVEQGVDAPPGYPGASEERVMRPPRRGRMLIASVELERSFKRRARSARGWLVAWLICLLLPCWFGYFPFWVNALYGEPGVATVVSKRTKLVKRRKKADYRTDVVTFRIDGANREFIDWMRPSEGWPAVGARVPVFYAPNWVTYARAGKTPTLDLKDGEDGRAVAGVAFPVLLLIALGIGSYFRRVPWWERKRLDEHLVDSTKPEPK